MPSWFSTATAQPSTQTLASASKSKSKRKDKDPTYTTPQASRLTPAPSASSSAIPPKPAPKLQSQPPPMSAGSNMRAGKTTGAVAGQPREAPQPIAKPSSHRLLVSSTHAEVGIDPSAARTVRFQLPPAHPEPSPPPRTRGSQYVTITPAAAAERERERRPQPSPLPIPVASPAARQEFAQSAQKTFTAPVPVTHAPRIGPFKLLKVLNSGVFAASYAAQDTGSGRVVCVRVSSKEELRKTEKLRKGLLVEGQIYKLIAASAPRDRAHLMELHGILQNEERVLFVMPLMQCDLVDAIEAAGPRGIDRALVRRWVAQLTLGIDALHRMGIIHRDLKPENVLVDATGPGGNVRIADFNAALLVHGGGPAEDGEVYTNERVGSEPYLAWEADKGRWHGKMVDWWALGCITFDLLTNTLLFIDHRCRETYVWWSQKLDGMSWPAYAGEGKLSDEEESLVCGLVDLHPWSRFQLRHLRHHTYFFDENSVNIFDTLLREHPADLLTVGRHAHLPPSSAALTVQVADDLQDAALLHASPRPVKVRTTDRGRAFDVEAEADVFCAFGWVNRRGIWRS